MFLYLCQHISLFIGDEIFGFCDEFISLSDGIVLLSILRLYFQHVFSNFFDKFGLSCYLFLLIIVVFFQINVDLLMMFYFHFQLTYLYL
jgi:hypothetical protein